MSPVAASPTTATRAIVVVARDRLGLYEYLRTSFRGLRDVEVILDRRIASERVEISTDGATRHEGEPDVYDELTLRGFIVKRVE